MNAPGPMSQTAKFKRRATYATREAQAARTYNTPLPYFRLDDPLCRNLLGLAADPSEFDGLKLLFPFVREMSLMGFPMKKEKLGVWMQLSFCAGHDLGRAHPEFLGDVLPGRELAEAERRLGVLAECSREEHLSFDGLSGACAHIAKAQWSQAPENQVLGITLDAVIKTFRAGYAAATTARCDPRRSELVWDIPPRIGNGIADIASRVLIGAPLNGVGKSVLALLEHPLLRLTREYYEGQPKQCQTVLRFLRRQLRGAGVKSETECPTGELDLLDWLASGLEYGYRIQARRPRLLNQIFRECGQSGLREASQVVRGVMAQAGGTDPARLLPRLKQWQNGAYGWQEPGYFGEAMLRVVYFVDFAVWIPWVLASGKEV